MRAARPPSLMFFRPSSTPALPAPLRDTLPPLLWVTGLTRANEALDSQAAAVHGRPIDGGAQQALIDVVDGALVPRFDVAASIEGTLLETYRTDLVPTLEMKLPFNYSLLPSWVKSLGRAMKGKAPASVPVEFPPGTLAAPQFAVEWLRDLAALTGRPRDARALRSDYPDGHRAALVITYDVDTDWLLRHPKWIDRFCDLEDAHGLRGAYYCVPMYCRSRAARDGIRRLQSRGREIGCHGYNHDAKWPLLDGRAFKKRLDAVRAFADEWGVRGFRSEWLWRTPRFFEALATVFQYDSSVPTMLPAYSHPTRNGCSTCRPYRTYGDLVELPVTVAADEWRHLKGLSPAAHFAEIFGAAKVVVARGGLVMLALHPQSHQAANEATFAALSWLLTELKTVPRLFHTTPSELATWVVS